MLFSEDQGIAAFVKPLYCTLNEAWAHRIGSKPGTGHLVTVVEAP